MKQRVLDMISEVSEAIDKVPQLTHIGNPILRQKCESVSVKEGVEIAKDLVSALEKYRKLSGGIGAGIAAPQIGLSKAIFVTTGKNGYEIYINPKIIKYSKETNFYRESCLSSRMVWNDVERPENIEMVWTDSDGEKHQEKFSSFKARLLQHEYDHLLGIVCLDKAIPGTVEYSGNVKEERFRYKSINDNE
jgi:peptide deformylase